MALAFTELIAALAPFLKPLAGGAVVVAYLHYEITYGRVSKWMVAIHAITNVLVALAEEVDGVDEDMARKQLPETPNSPTDYRVGDDGRLRRDGGPENND